MNDERSGIEVAALHALSWWVAANAVGVWLALLLVFPEASAGEWTYGRWVPVHLNGQLYGWTALPLVAWLFRIYDVRRRWAEAALAAWSAALAFGCWSWLEGGSSGKIFLDWRGASLGGWVAALAVLWGVLAVAWWRRRGRWRLVVLASLALVPWMMAVASSPATYPPVDETTGGPTGASLLGSTLFVVGLMLVLPMALLPRRDGAPGPGRGVWVFFAASWVLFGWAEAKGGTHLDGWQVASMLALLPWAVILPRLWRGDEWPRATRRWAAAALGWWALLVVSGVTAYLPEVLDRLKFTNGLVAHSHLAMAGFTTSFGALLLGLLGIELGGWGKFALWHGAAFGMVTLLAAMGWAEGGEWGWMVDSPWWREAGLVARGGFGLGMLAASAGWWWEAAKNRRRKDR